MHAREAAGIVLAAGSAVSAQSVVTYQADDGSNHMRFEMSMRASKTTRDILIDWHEFINPQGSAIVYYNASTDGYVFRTNPGAVPLPPGWYDGSGSDPTVAFNFDGTGYVEYIGWDIAHTQVDFLVASKAPGQAYASTASTLGIAGKIDKGVIVAGPPEGGAAVPDLVGMVCIYSDNYTVEHTGQVAFDLTDPGQRDPVGRNNLPWGNRGDTSAVVILRNTPTQPSLAGRWVTACAEGGPTKPKVAYSHNGREWLDSENPVTATIPCDPPCSQQRENVVFWTVSTPDASLFPGGGPFVPNQPTLATDPRDERVQYLTFLGRTPSGINSNPADVDIFVAVSTDGGVDFTGDPSANEQPGDRVLHLRGLADLGDPPGSIRMFPNVTVDMHGQVHVAYYVATRIETEDPNPDPVAVWRYKVKLATIPSFSVFPHPAVTTTDLTGWFSLDGPYVRMNGDRPILGDYMNMIDSRACEVVVGYFAREPGSSAAPSVRVSVVRLSTPDCQPGAACYANCDGSTESPILNVADFTCFLDSYASGCGTPITGPGGYGPCYANCDGSTTPPFLNVADFACFLQKYSMGCP
jgi:hypothetical protein